MSMQASQPFTVEEKRKPNLRLLTLQIARLAQPTRYTPDLIARLFVPSSTANSKQLQDCESAALHGMLANSWLS